MSKAQIKPKRRPDGETWSSLTSNDILDKDQVQAGITANAYTAGQIKTLYESNVQTNAFTDGEKSKLGLIEDGATADQTGAEIKVAYEGELNTNAFTDGEKSKLTGIEALADVTDATNVEAAGAVMESDTTTAAMSFVVDEDDMVSNLDTKVPTQQSVKAYVASQITLEKSYKGGYDASTDTPSLDDGTPIAGIKKGDVYDVTVADNFFTEPVEVGDTLRAKQDDPTTLAHWVIIQTNLTPASIKTAYESNADTNAFTDAEKSKLAAITNTGSGVIIASSERTNLSTAYAHSQVAHAPSDAQKNSDITKAEIEAKLTGAITSHSHALPVANSDYYIATTGSDTTGDGTSGTPWATINKAIAHLANYRIDPSVTCVIHLAAGTYNFTTTQVIQHPDGQFLKIFGAGVATTFIRSTASQIISLSDGNKLWWLSSLTIENATYSGTQTAISLGRQSEIAYLDTVDVARVYRCLQLTDGSRVRMSSCDFLAYAYAIALGSICELIISNSTMNGTGGAALPRAMEVNFGARLRIDASSVLSNNDVAMSAAWGGEIMDSGATMTTNTTDYTPARSTAGTVTYNSTFGRILGF